MWTTLCAAAALLVVLGGGAAGAAEPAPQATDPCGDGGTAATTGGERTQVEPAGAGQDLRSAWVRVVRPAGGEAALLGTLGTCGPASEGADYALRWEYDDGCSLVLRRTRTVVGERPVALLEQLCDDGTPVQFSEPRVDLPDAAFTASPEGAVFRVPLALVPAEVLPRLAPGATWTATTGTASAPPTTAPGYGFGLRVGNADHSTDVSLRADDLRGGGGTVEQPQP